MGRIKNQVRNALKNMKRHYFVLVLVCIINMLLCGEFFDTAQFIKIDFFSGDTESIGNQMNIYDVLSLWQQGENDDSVNAAEELMTQIIDKSMDNRFLGHSRGVIAGLVNKISSGYFLVRLLTLLSSFFHSRNVARAIVIAALLVIISLYWMFAGNMCVVVSRRLALEGRCYTGLSFRRMLHFFRIGRWVHIAWVMLVSYTLQILWCFTLVGGPIKRYSYYLVPYIVSENPDLTARQAIALSKKMMVGHKKEIFFKELLLLITPGLSLITGGLSDILFFNPFRIAFFSECYVSIREDAKQGNVDGVELLCDDALFSVPEAAKLREVYADVAHIQEQVERTGKPLGRVSRFFADWFGLTFSEREKEREYERYVAARGAAEDFIAQMDGKAYPVRLCPVREQPKRVGKNSSSYLCHYSIWSLVLLFMMFSCIGWLWEVGLHFFNEGIFVNRGALHGPWLPVYGTGGIMILLLLYRFRSKPGLEFTLAISLAGIVEFGTSAVMEFANDGMRWWDYTGYFLNFGGRICAEGLLFFGIGGLAVVYLIAPAVNNWLREQPWKRVVIVSVILAMLFVFDVAYSSKHPNTGEGITTDTVQEMQISRQTERFNIL